MPLQPGPKSQAGDASPGQDSSCSDAPRFGVTRHTVAPGCTCRLAPEFRSLSDMCLQPHRSCDKRTANNRRSQPSPCPFSPTGPRKGPPRRPRCRKSALTPVPLGIRAEFAAPYATGYKSSLSGGLLRAFRSAGVQNVTFTRVFAPRLWNTTCHRSASRVRPVGVQYRLYHGVHGSQTASHFTCKLLYTSMASPKASKLPCHERRGARCPTLGALPNAPAAARLECIKEVATQLSADRSTSGDPRRARVLPPETGSPTLSPFAAS